MKDKFKTNKFAKKWQEELKETAKKIIAKNKETILRIPLEDKYSDIDYILENAEQVKSWNKYGIGMQVSLLWSVTIAFFLGFVVCAILVSFISSSTI